MDRWSILSLPGTALSQTVEQSKLVHFQHYLCPLLPQRSLPPTHIRTQPSLPPTSVPSRAAQRRAGPDPPSFFQTPDCDTSLDLSPPALLYLRILLLPTNILSFPPFLTSRHSRYPAIFGLVTNTNLLAISPWPKTSWPANLIRSSIACGDVRASSPIRTCTCR